MSFVYFIRRPSTDSIKVGFSADPKRRLRQLQTGADERLELLAVIEATQDVETEIHRYLSSHRLIGEWFQWSDDLLNLLNPDDKALKRIRASVSVKNYKLPPAWSPASDGPAS